MTQLKLALRILRRRKFFTFISLFGISFTIMALVVIAAMGDAALGDNPPLSKRDRLVFASHFRSEKVVPDTSYIVDSTELADGSMKYDSTMQIGENTESDNNSELGFHLYDKYLKNLGSAKNQAFYAPSATYDSYLGGRKVTFSASLTDAAFWEVFDYNFLEGSPYTAEDVVAGAAKIVLTERAVDEYFGTETDGLIGRTLNLGDKAFTIVGVVENTVASNGLGQDVFLPYTLSGPEFFLVNYHGPAIAAFEASTPDGRQAIVTELKDIADRIEPVPKSDRNRFFLEGLTFSEEFATTFSDYGKNRTESYSRLSIPVAILLLMLVILPALNLMNINVSRVYERSSEIAVRKSFGASDMDIMRQFLVETLLITVLGGLLGALLAGIMVWVINSQHWLGNFTLKFTGEVVLYSAVLIAVFGLLTGLLPAWRMAQTRIATSLR